MRTVSCRSNPQHKSAVQKIHIIEAFGQQSNVFRKIYEGKIAFKIFL